MIQLISCKYREQTEHVSLISEKQTPSSSNDCISASDSYVGPLNYEVLRKILPGAFKKEAALLLTKKLGEEMVIFPKLVIVT